MNIVYLVFGNKITYYQQVIFSIYTALVHKGESDNIIVLTEEPTMFNQLKDKIIVLPLDNEVVKEWKGKYDYMFRLKIKALEFLANKFPNEDMLYLDGDTFVYNSLTPLRDKLEQGTSIMHIDEGKLNKFTTKTGKRFWKELKGNTYGGILITEDTCMWNAGVLGVSKSNFSSISLALDITDQMCQAGIKAFTKEQLAFSLAFNSTGDMTPADHIIGHYWGNKEQWDDFISDWLKKAFMHNYTVDEVIANVRSIPLDQIPYYLKHSNTLKRLSRKLQNIFQPKNPQFIKK
ncbi:hypothetical protein VSP10_04485 [Myroides odoratimimus]|uniref:hypothetical protein n=1 Tax=Myroides odoratimimus TaxID=76832 RepID=UPI00046A2780|nr:hypothetical protein [Myroides odoratimimus]MDM1459564.1 hypothetical protein [Myroides odoratimimus]MEC4052041.1 hypothetical protein [Myroides odoratimimus]